MFVEGADHIVIGDPDFLDHENVQEAEEIPVAISIPRRISEIQPENEMTIEALPLAREELCTLYTNSFLTGVNDVIRETHDMHAEHLGHIGTSALFNHSIERYRTLLNEACTMVDTVSDTAVRNRNTNRLTDISSHAAILLGTSIQYLSSSVIVDANAAPVATAETHVVSHQDQFDALYDHVVSLLHQFTTASNEAARQEIQPHLGEATAQLLLFSHRTLDLVANAIRYNSNV